MLKPVFQLALSQQLAMTPQMQQAIRLLQLSTQELEQEVRTALESNVMLEAEDDLSWGAGTPAATDDTAVASPVDSSPAEPDITFDEHSDVQYMSAGSRRPVPDSINDREPEAVEQAPLREHLLWQLEVSSIQPRDLAIGVALIDSLDEDGYLVEELESIRDSLEPDLTVEVGEIEAVLHRVQMLDPVGVGARNLAECLRLQLRQVEPTTPGFNVAMLLIDDHLEDLARSNVREVGRLLKIDPRRVEEAAALIRMLDPRPGAALAAPPDEYIVPDVIVGHQNGRWTVGLNSSVAPRLRVNEYYASLLHTDPGLHGNEMLRSDLREARWLIKSLEMRQSTLIKVASALIARQQDFLEHGDEFMRPLILKDIAAEIDVHESTVSRVTTNKYMQTPRGVVSFKSFFSNYLATGSGGQRSVTAIRAVIKKLIAGENASKPLSDGQIADHLREQDIQVARRTVAKYREALGIPAKAVRRQWGYHEARPIVHQTMPVA